MKAMPRREEYARYRDYYRTYAREWARSVAREPKRISVNRERNRAFYAQHREKLKAAARLRMSRYRKRPEAKRKKKEWERLNQARRREARRHWTQKNRERVCAQKRESYQRCKARELAKKRARYKTDKNYRDSAIARAAIRNPMANHAKRTGGDVFSPTEWRALCEQFNHRCALCGERAKLTVDHIVPVSRGGSSRIENIQPLCLSCNSKKGAKLYPPKENLPPTK
jgi:5-methylcytosine-specific restriction endonuclease McrA